MSAQQSSSSRIWIRFERSAGEVVVRSFEQPFTLGRATQCDVQFETRIVSSVHARIAFSRGEWVVQDLDSRSSTYVNGERVQHAALRGRATLQLGEGGPLVEVSVGEPFPGAAPSPAESRSAPAPAAPAVSPAAAAPDAAKERSPVYRADTFALPLPEDWQDRTVYTLLGPLNDDLQHNITVNVEPEAPYDTVDDYADEQARVLEGELYGCRILKKEAVSLHNGMPAYRILYSWTPSEVLSVFQELILVLHEGTAYRLAATFTRKTRKTLGPEIEHIMLGFIPDR